MSLLDLNYFFTLCPKFPVLLQEELRKPINVKAIKEQYYRYTQEIPTTVAGYNVIMWALSLWYLRTYRSLIIGGGKKWEKAFLSKDKSQKNDDIRGRILNVVSLMLIIAKSSEKNREIVRQKIILNISKAPTVTDEKEWLNTIPFFDAIPVFEGEKLRKFAAGIIGKSSITQSYLYKPRGMIDRYYSPENPRNVEKRKQDFDSVMTQDGTFKKTGGSRRRKSKKKSNKSKNRTLSKKKSRRTKK